MTEREIKVRGISYSSISGAVLVAFFMFWSQSGWYRVDCALGVVKACELIASEKEYNK